MIAIRNVTKEFDVNKQKVTALSDVNFTIEKGDIFGIIGFSGAGKSTLLRMILDSKEQILPIKRMTFLKHVKKWGWFFNSSIC